MSCFFFAVNVCTKKIVKWCNFFAIMCVTCLHDQKEKLHGVMIFFVTRIHRKKSTCITTYTGLEHQQVRGPRGCTHVIMSLMSQGVLRTNNAESSFLHCRGVAPGKPLNPLLDAQWRPSLPSLLLPLQLTMYLLCGKLGATKGLWYATSIPTWVPCHKVMPKERPCPQ